MGRMDDVSRDVRRDAMISIRDIFFIPGHPDALKKFRDKFLFNLELMCRDRDSLTRETAEGKIWLQLKGRLLFLTNTLRFIFILKKAF